MANGVASYDGIVVVSANTCAITPDQYTTQAPTQHRQTWASRRNPGRPGRDDQASSTAIAAVQMDCDYPWLLR
jgi:hypothetical protein